MRHFYRGLSVLALGLLVISCGNKPAEKTVVRNYPQNFKTDIAWIVLEWNGKPYGYGSGVLVDREHGAFYTNKHVSDTFDTLGKGSHKIFFNGKVYNAKIVKTPKLVDAALIRITDPFDSSEFPETAKFSTEDLKVGDQLFMGGLHPHGYWIREADKDEGYDYPLVPIYKDYYNMGTIHLDREKEVVFEKLEGKVVELDLTWAEVMKRLEERTGEKFPPGSFTEQAENRSNLFIEAKILKDHKFPFGGLSGSPARNSKGEIVGILTRQDTHRFDYDEKELEEKGQTEIKKQLWDTVYIVPIKFIENLRQYLN